MSETNAHCKIDKRLDLGIEDFGCIEQLLAEQNLIESNYFFYTTSLGEELKFVRIRKGLWIIKEYNVTIKAIALA